MGPKEPLAARPPAKLKKGRKEPAGSRGKTPEIPLPGEEGGKQRAVGTLPGNKEPQVVKGNGKPPALVVERATRLADLEDKRDDIKAEIDEARGELADSMKANDVIHYVHKGEPGRAIRQYDLETLTRLRSKKSKDDVGGTSED